MNDQIKEYVKQYFSDNLLKLFKNQSDWYKLEPRLGNFYFGLFSYFTPSDYELVPNEKDTINIPKENRFIEAKTIQYFAVNFRGLYQKNGRATIITQHNNLKAIQTDQKIHSELHKYYLKYLCRKTESINQLFLSNTDLNSICIHYDMEEKGKNSEIELSDGGYHAKFIIRKDIFSLWNKNTDDKDPIFIQWGKIIDSFLKNENKEIHRITINTFINSRKYIENILSDKVIDLLGTPFFQQWRKLNKVKFNSSNDCVQKFETWILSLCWLAFYCNEKHAGNYFISFRLSNIFKLEKQYFNKLPKSSISFVSTEKYADTFRNNWDVLIREISRCPLQKTISECVIEKFNGFIKGREILQGENDEEKKLVKYLKELNKRNKDKSMPIHIAKLFFLIKMGRCLVGKKHEGHNLHFTFIFGFGFDRIDAESHGFLREIITDIGEQWKQFEKKAVDPYVQKERGKFTEDTRHFHENDPIAEAMSKWINNADYSMKPWDMAMYFEEGGDNNLRPIPSSLVQIQSTDLLNGDTIATEYQLRKALTNLTNKNIGMCALLIIDSGMILYLSGKSIYISCSKDIKIQQAIEKIGLSQDDKTHEEIFNEYLTKVLKSGVFRKLSEIKRKTLCQTISEVCEVLVSLGYGALLIIRFNPKQDPLKRIYPLNPAWKLKPSENGPDINDQRGILLYALMAALDGATEILLPENDDDSIILQVRKNVIPEKPIWTYDEEEDVVITDEYKQKISIMSLLGKGTRHHSALAYSLKLGKDAVIITVSSDGPITFWQDGAKISYVEEIDYQPKLKP